MTAALPTVPLPGTDRRMTRPGLGAMHLSIAGRPPRDEALAVVRRAVELGVGLIDTADAYALDDADAGHNEALIAEALAGMGLRVDDPDAPVVATKGGRTRPGGAWAIDGRPEHLREACHASLRRLGVERIPLYHLHTPDPDVPFEDSVGALARLQEEGKVAAVGLSNVGVERIRAAGAIVPVAAVQNSFSPWDVGRGRPPVLELCERERIPLLAYSPLGGRDRAARLSASEGLRTVAQRVGATPQEVVLAWLMAQSPMVVPIPGATRPESVESSARAAELTLSADDVRAVRTALRRLPGSRGLVARVLGRVKRALGG